MKVILASSSVFRKQLLSKLQIPFRCISPNIDESRQKSESVTNYVKRLSIEKASKISGMKLFFSSPKKEKKTEILIEPDLKDWIQKWLKD